MTYPGQPQPPGGVPNYGPPPGHPQGYPQGGPVPGAYPQPYAGPPQGYPQAGYATPVAYAPNGQPLASFGDRLVAYLIDGAVLLGVNLVLAIPMVIALVVVITGAASQIETDPTTGEVTSSPGVGVFIGVPLLIELGWIVLIFAATYVYHVEMFGKTGVTVGKRAMKLGIIRGDVPGAPINRGVLAKRLLTQVVPGFVVPFWGLIDGLWQLWDKPYQQCLHDKAAGTIVVKVG